MTGLPKFNIQWDGKISLGNVLTIGTLAIGLLVAFTELQSGQEQTARLLNETRLTMIENKAFSDERALVIDNRVRVLEVSNASMSADLRNIQTGVNDVKSSITQLLNR